jgi:hypothetical protein
MFRRNIASAIADLPLWADGNWKTGSTVATVGENPSAKGRLPNTKEVITTVWGWYCFFERKILL